MGQGNSWLINFYEIWTKANALNNQKQFNIK